MTEPREGGTLPGRAAPDGQPFVQTLDSKRFDGGLVAEIPLAPGTFNIRGSGMTPSDAHHFGPTIAGDRRRAFFGEASFPGKTGRSSFLAGAPFHAHFFRTVLFSGFNQSFNV